MKLCPQFVQTLWADVLVQTIKDAGVEYWVVSPGSRSTPIALAASRAGLTIQVIIDERSAAFFALGHAKMTGRPVALLCTSGSAAANYFPAIVEAKAAYCPLLVLTADRPPELHGCGAPQTMDQQRLYGAHVNSFVDVGVPRRVASAFLEMKRKIIQGITATITPKAGPVHINIPCFKPLEATNAANQAERLFDQEIRALTCNTVCEQHRSLASAAELDELAGRLTSLQRGVIVAGPAPISQSRIYDTVYALADALQIPIFAESSSQLRYHGRATHSKLCDAFPLFLGTSDARTSFAPEYILQIASPPTSAALNHYIAENADAYHVVLSETGKFDPLSTVDHHIFGNIEHTLTQLLHLLPARTESSEWFTEISASNRRAWGIVETTLCRKTPAMSEAQAMNVALCSIPDGTTVAISNSLPIRSIDLFCPGKSARAAIWSQRGVNGIDGIIAGSCGASAAKPTAPLLTIIGDVAFAHDLSSLALVKIKGGARVILVIDNGGGRIFKHLPIADHLKDHSELFDQLWLTKTSINFESAAKTYSLEYCRVETPQHLHTVLKAALGPASEKTALVVHAIVSPNSAAADQALMIRKLCAHLSAAQDEQQ